MKNFFFTLVLFLVLSVYNCKGQTYQLTDLGALIGTNSYAQGINNQGQVVGYWETVDGAHAFLYQSGIATDLGSLGAENNYALSINNVGQIVGFSKTSSGTTAFLYQNGGMTNLNGLSDLDSYAFGINDNGQIVGYVDTPNGDQAFIYNDGNTIGLGTLGGTNSIAFGINNILQVVGSSLTANNITTHAFLWQNGIINDLNQFQPNDSGWNLIDAHGINDFGNIVGWGLINNQERAFLFSNSGFATDLGVLLGGTNSYALGLNNSNQVVGASSTANGNHAVVWQNKTVNDLNNLVNAMGWNLKEACGINDVGQIVGWGLFNGQVHAFLLTPITTPASSKRLTLTRSQSFIPLDMPPSGSFTVTITNPINNATFPSPTNLAINATTADSIGTVTQVQFYVGVKLLDVDTTSPYNITWSNAPVGLHALTVIAYDNTGLVATSSVVNITVSTNLLPIADAHVRDGSFTNTNFGTNTVMECLTTNGTGNNRDIYFKFDLTGVGNIKSAMLNVFAAVNPAGAISNTVYSVTNTSWTEANIKWSNKPTRVTALTTNIMTGTNWYLFDVTSFVKAQQAGGQNMVSLALHDPTNYNRLISINSKENTVNKPVLVVVTTNSPLSVSITNPVNNAVFNASTNIIINANVTDTDGNVTQVQYYAGLKLLSVNTTPPYGMVWSNVAVGTYALKAIVSDDVGLFATSSVVNITVSTNLLPIADAHVRDGSFTNTNFGTNTVMECLTTNGTGNNRDIYFKFDLTGVSSNISSAKLNIFAGSSTGGTITNAAYSVTNTSWTETNITWSNKPTRVTVLATNTIAATNWYLFDVTAYTKSQKTAGQNLISLAMHDLTNSTRLIYVNSRENSTNKPVLIISITNAPPNVVITNPANNTVLSAPANVAIGVTASDDDTVSQIQVFQGTTSLMTFTNAPYNMTWSNVTSGAYALTARATDNYGLVTTSSVVNVFIDAPPSVTLTNPANGSFFAAGSNVGLGASAFDSDGTVTQVQFFQGSTSLKTLTNAPYTMVWSNVVGGGYALTARAKDNNGLISTSSVVNITVDSPPSVTITSPINNVPISSLTNIILSATASDSDGTVTQVQFFQGTNNLGVITNSPFSMAWSNSTGGSYNFTAVATDDLGLSTTSSIVTVTVVTFLASDALRLWLKADAIIGLPTNNAPIGTWPDSSGYTNNATQTTSANKPAYWTNVINGKPVVRFDGTNDYLNFPNFMANFTQGELYVVLRVTTNFPTQSKSAWRFGTNSNYSFYPNTDGSLTESFGLTYSYSLGVPTQPITQFHLYNFTVTPPFLNTYGSYWNGYSAWINGILINQNGGYAAFSASPRLGASSASFSGDIAEILIFNRTLTDAERKSVGIYLIGKYNFLSLPPTPSALIANPLSSSQININWQVNPQAAGTTYVLERKVVGGDYQQIATVTSIPFYMDTGLAAQTQYYYRLRYQNYAGYSDYSPEVSVTTFAAESDFPTADVDLWYGADVLAGLTNGASVVSLVNYIDQTRNASWRSPSGYPTYVTNAINGYPAIRFATNNSVNFSLPKLSTNTGSAEMLVVLKAGSRMPLQTDSPWTLGGSSTITTYPETDGSISDDFASTTAHNMGVPFQHIDEYHIYNIYGGSNIWGAEIDGVNIASTTNNSFGIPSYYRYLGGSIDGPFVSSPQFYGDIVEFITFDRILTLGERQSVENYLNSKYAIITNGLPTIELITPANGAVYRAGSYINISASLSYGGTRTQVQFFNGTTVLGTFTNSPYIMTLTNVPAGDYALTAVATDNYGRTATSSMVNITVDTAPIVTITNPVNNAVFFTPSNINLKADASDVDGTVAQVQFFQGLTSLGVVTNAPYGLVWSNVSVGNYSITAVAIDNYGLASTSAVVSMTVQNPVSVALTNPLNNTLIVASLTNVVLAASASDSNGVITQVQFFQGLTSLGIVTNAPYTMVWSNVSAGAYALTAQATENHGLVVTSSVVNVIIDTPPGITLINPPNDARFVAVTNINLGASVLDDDGIVTQVQFFQGLTSLGIVTNAPYTMVWSNVSVGAYALTAQATDNYGLISTSGVANITVAGISIISPTNNLVMTVSNNLQIIAAVIDNVGISQVEFFQGSTSLGIVTNAPYSLVWNNVPAGIYTLTARATDSGGLLLTSSVVNVICDTNPNTTDTDGDGVSDYIEYLEGRNPIIIGSVPDTNGIVNLQIYTPLQ